MQRLLCYIVVAVGLLFVLIPANAAVNTNTKALSTPKLSAPANTTNGVKVSWSAVKGAEKYRVFVKNGSAWKNLADTKTTSYIHKTAISGKRYTYTVRCITSNGKNYTSDFNKTGKSVIYIKSPVIASMTDTAKGTLIRWSACPGAHHYRVYVKSGSSWITLGDTKKLYFTHTDANHKMTYTYTVRCLNSKNMKVSAFNAIGWKHKYVIPATLKTPAVTGFENTESGTRIYWNAVDGAKNYRILIKSGSAWKTLGHTTKTYYDYNKGISGVSYSYTVCCVNAAGTAYTSAYNTAGYSFTYVKTPDISRVVNTASGPMLTWDYCAGAAKYRILILTENGWQKLDQTSETSYIHISALPATQYTYTVCCLDTENNILSAYRPSGVSIFYEPDPTYHVMTKSAFSDEVRAILKADNATAPTNPNAPLSRLGVSDVLVKELGYKTNSSITLKDKNANSKINTAAFYGYFIPNKNDYIYPEQLITEKEHAAVLKEVARYARLKGKRILAFGDSIMYGSGNGGHGIARLIADKYGMTYRSYAIVGATFSICNENPHIPDQIRKAYQAGSQADIILLNGGTNDMRLVDMNTTLDKFNYSDPGSSTFAYGFEYSMMMIRRYWKDTPILYIRAHNMNTCPDKLERAVGKYGLSIAESWSADTVDIYSNTAFNTEFQDICDRYTKYKDTIKRHDSIHPNALGYATFYIPLISDKVARIL